MAWEACDHVEVLPQDRPFHRAHDLLVRTTLDRVTDGRIQPSNDVGSGVQLDDQAVQRFSYRPWPGRRAIMLRSFRRIDLSIAPMICWFVRRSTALPTAAFNRPTTLAAACNLTIRRSSGSPIAHGLGGVRSC